MAMREVDVGDYVVAVVMFEKYGVNEDGVTEVEGLSVMGNNSPDLNDLMVVMAAEVIVTKDVDATFKNFEEH